LNASTDLATLIAGTARRHDPAFAQLYASTAAKLLGVILRIVRDRAMAEDVLQEVFLRIWQNASTYAPESGRPMTWLIAIARYRAIDFIRQRRFETLPPNEDGSDPLDAIAEPRDRERDIIDTDRLRLCLGQLEAPQRRCVLEAYYEGYSREELASRFAMPVNTIKTWLHRGTQTLRTCLDAS
jgi:RNA polymerase sigma factor (sigma-70 family)